MLWRSAPLEIMMRSNAPITASLALAALYLSPAALLAKLPAHHPAHTAATATSTTTKKRTHKPAGAQAAEPAPATRNKHTTRRRKHHPQQVETADPPIIIRAAHTPASSMRSGANTRLTSGTKSVAVPSPALPAADSTPRKATSSDFLRAAGQSEPKDSKSIVATSPASEEDT